MDIFGIMMVFAILWWIVFFAVLPIGVRSQLDENAVVEGTEGGRSH